MPDAGDGDLGMGRAITRRDFLNGVGVALTGTALYPWVAEGGQAPAFAPEQAPGYYPPALTGLRGSHAGSFEVAHALCDGRSWDADATDTRETYDLVVVGGGISGLAAAYFFRKSAGPAATILIVDNHDDFGGHAKRNEFRHGDRMLIGYGGTQSIEEPSRYSFETFERNLRDLLGRSLSGGGFDPARDIEAITVNRWPHGYADEGDALNDPNYASDAERPWVIARQRFGRIAIANSDAARRAYTDAAIDQAYRAVQELSRKS